MLKIYKSVKSLEIMTSWMCADHKTNSFTVTIEENSVTMNSYFVIGTQLMGAPN